GPGAVGEGEPRSTWTRDITPWARRWRREACYKAVSGVRCWVPRARTADTRHPRPDTSHYARPHRTAVRRMRHEPPQRAERVVPKAQRNASTIPHVHGRMRQIEQ